MLRLLVILLGLAYSAAPAAAQRSAIVVVSGENASIDALTRGRAGAVEALAERGIRLVAMPDGPACESPDCAPALAQRTAVEVVLLVVVDDAEVSVVAVAPGGAAFDARTAVDSSTDVFAAAAYATGRALDASSERAMGFLLVRTVPHGATVQIDGRDAGRAPLRRTLSVGTHLVEVRRPGGTGDEERVTVRAREETTVVFDENADADQRAAAPLSTPERSEPSPWNWLIGGALAVGGVVALISPISTLTREGECTEAIENIGCLERIHVGEQTGALLALGAALLVAAVVIEVTAPIRVGLSAGPTSAQLVVEADL